MSLFLTWSSERHAWPFFILHSNSDHNSIIAIWAFITYVCNFSNSFIRDKIRILIRSILIDDWYTTLFDVKDLYALITEVRRLSSIMIFEDFEDWIVFFFVKVMSLYLLPLLPHYFNYKLIRQFEINHALRVSHLEVSIYWTEKYLITIILAFIVEGGFYF